MSLKTAAKLMVPAGTPVQVNSGDTPVPKSLPLQVMFAGISVQEAKSLLVTLNPGPPPAAGLACDGMSAHTLFGVKTGGSGSMHAAPAVPPGARAAAHPSAAAAARTAAHAGAGRWCPHWRPRYSRRPLVRCQRCQSRRQRAWCRGRPASNRSWSSLQPRGFRKQLRGRKQFSMRFSSFGSSPSRSQSAIS